MQLIEAAAGPAADQPRPSKLKDLLLKIVLLTILSVALGWAQGWAASRTYKPEHVGGFHTGLLHGLLMPAALPGLLLGQNLPIYAPNNSGRAYNIGYIFGINTCGTLFFGISFWQRQGRLAQLRRSAGNGQRRFPPRQLRQRGAHADAGFCPYTIRDYWFSCCYTLVA